MFAIALGAALALPPVGGRPLTPPVYREKVLYDFQGGTDGYDDYAGIFGDPERELFGTTQNGGVGCAQYGGCGTVFGMVNIGKGYQKSLLYSFGGPPGDGFDPSSSNLIVDSTGSIFGATYYGGSGSCSISGAQGCGIVYQLTPAGSTYAETILYDFASPQVGLGPLGLAFGPMGVIYGITNAGGSGACNLDGFYGCGTLFMLTPSASGYAYTLIHKFKGGPSDGAYPNAPPIVDASGNIFGTTFRGGGGPCSSAGTGCGTVYEFRRTSSGFREHVLYSFQGGNDGALAQGGLVEYHKAIFGMTVFGGGGPCESGNPPGCGTLYEIAPSPSGYSEKVLHAFQGLDDGARPLGSLAIGPGGSLFGVTGAGGRGDCGISNITGCGVAFVYIMGSSGENWRVIHEFGLTKKDGTYPANDVVVSRKGTMFGATSDGGKGKGTCSVSGEDYGCGTVFKIE